MAACGPATAELKIQLKRIKGFFCSIMVKQIKSLKPAVEHAQSGLEYWYRQKRTLVDFRRGPLGGYFDGFASHLRAKGYSQHRGVEVLSRCCQFNAFLIDQGVSKCKELSESLVNSFLDVYLQDIRTNSEYYSPRVIVREALKHLFVYLIDIRKLGIRGLKGKRGPRVHDLRHTFALNRLLAWYRQGTNLSAKLPLLSTYLGHSTVTGTEVYLQATAELLESAGKRFHARCAIPMSRGKGAL